MATLPISGRPNAVSEAELEAIIDDVAHCPAAFQILVKSLLLPGLVELAETAVPAHSVICEKDRVFPGPRSSRYFTTHLPAGTRITRLDGLGHIPMFEAPELITEVISDFLNEYSSPVRAVNSPGA